jgi:hypothetical protein
LGELEWLCAEVLKYVPHRQWVFSIPKRLRIYFMMDRKLLAKLSQCAWKVLNLYLTQAVAYDDAKVGAATKITDSCYLSEHLTSPKFL